MKKPLFAITCLLILLTLSACQTNTSRESEPSWIAAYKKSKHAKDETITSENLWNVITDSFELNDYADNARVKAQVAFYTKNKKFFDKVSANAQPYLYYVFDEIKKGGLPSEMIILPMVESGFDPYVYSSGKAAGIWQFVPGTGRLYGLKQAGNYDGRRDILTSTQAAVKYLQRLNQEMNGDWLLTLAAYNSGEGAIKKAVEANRRQGKKTDYFSLNLSRETQLFVPRILAISQMLRDPERYNIKLNFISTKPYFAPVQLPHNSTFSGIAAKTGVSLAELKTLNTGYSKTANVVDEQHAFLVPADKANQFTESTVPLLTSTDAGITASSPTTYTIKSGDSLSKIAQHFKVSINDLKKWNPKISSKSKLALGDQLIIYTKNH